MIGKQRKINKVSKEVRKQYDSMIAQSLAEQDVLPTEPPLTPHPAENNGDKTKLPSLKKRNRIADILFTTILLFMLIVLMSAILQRYYVGSVIVVNGASMEPTYLGGQEVWINKGRAVKRGDVVVLYRNDVANKFWAEFAVGTSAKNNGKYAKLIKRVIAFGGDKLWVEEKDGNYVLVIETPQGEIREDYYTVNGQPVVFHDAHGNLDESNPVYVPYVAGDYKNRLGVLSGTTKENPFVVREGRFFYMGDHRLVSSDSRSPEIADVPLDRIIGVIS